MPRLFALASVLFAAFAGSAGGGGATALTGWITDTECGPNHAPMIAKGGMGNDDAECTRRCVAKGATYGFVDADRGKFFQLDDQDAPAALAGRKVRVEGRVEGDTIYVTRIAPAE
jgi:hypothetical protein